MRKIPIGVLAGLVSTTWIFAAANLLTAQSIEGTRSILEPNVPATSEPAVESKPNLPVSPNVPLVPNNPAAPGATVDLNGPSQRETELPQDKVPENKVPEDKFPQGRVPEDFAETLPSPSSEATKLRRHSTDGSASRVELPLESDAPSASKAVPRLGLAEEKRLQGTSELLKTLSTEMEYDVVLAGPVHEALITLSAERAQRVVDVVSEQPPAPVKEQPSPDGSIDGVPEFNGHDVRWIDGYWAWFDDASRFVWVSGLYRDFPPGRSWKPGYWSETTGGYRWTSGYWAETGDRAVDSISYLPPPPPPKDSAPSTPATNPDSFWMPGHWEHKNGEYVWTNGYWTARTDNWIWQPAYYVNSPQGSIFVSGYWDYEPQFRGQAFAPVVFRETKVEDSAYVLRPRYPLSRPAACLLHLFVKKDSRQLYYGDFYDDEFVKRGYLPWYLSAEDASANDESPLLSYYAWKYSRYGFDFVSSMSRYATHFRGAPAIRPAQQLAVNRDLMLQDGLAGQVNAANFDEIVRGNVGGQTARFLGNVTQQTPLRNQPQSPVQPALSQSDPAGSSSAAGRTNTPERTASFAAPMGASNLPGLSPQPLGGPALYSIGGGRAVLVFPGGRIGLPTPNLVPNGIGLMGPGLRLPAFPPNPIGRLRGRR